MKSGLSGGAGSQFFQTVFSIMLMVALMLGSYRASYALASDLLLEFNSGKLSANVSGAPFQKVLETLSARCGITVFLDSSLQSKKISVKFDKLSLEEGIKKLVNPYSSAMIFGKRTTPDARNEFYVSELKVFDSSNKKASYILLGEKTSDHVDEPSTSSTFLGEVPKSDMAKKVVPVPEERKDAAMAAALHKKVSSSVLRTRITRKMTELRQLEQRTRHEDEEKRRSLQRFQEELKRASGSELNRIRSQISVLTADIRNSKKVNAAEQKRLQRELDQLRRQIATQEG